jgi:hypothetical protein
MKTFEFWATEWSVITQAPHIDLAGLVVVLAATSSVTKCHYSSQLGSPKERIATLQERVALAPDNERDVKEKLIEVQNLVVELNDQIEAN